MSRIKSLATPNYFKVGDHPKSIIISNKALPYLNVPPLFPYQIVLGSSGSFLPHILLCNLSNQFYIHQIA